MARWTALFVLVAWALAGCTPADPPITVQNVIALSNHHVELTLTPPVGANAGDPTAYRITAPDGGQLYIESGELSPDGVHVVLVTGPQRAVQYSLILASDGSVVGSFPGSQTVEPALQAAVPLSNNSVLLSFSGPMALDAASPANYGIQPVNPAGGQPALAVTAATLGPDGSTVVLTTSSQLATEYRVAVQGVTSYPNGIRIDPTRDTADFAGIGAPDTQAPKVLGANSPDATTIVVQLNEPVEFDAAAIAALVNQPSAAGTNPVAQVTRCKVAQRPCPDASLVHLEITGMQLAELGTQLRLTTGMQISGVQYTVQVSSLLDLAGNPIDDAADTATAVLEGDPDAWGSGPPRVVGAVSTGNTTVTLTFSKPMGEGAEQAQNYAIVQENVNPEAGALGVLSARYLSSDRTAVELTTRSQNELVYRVTAVNVKDDEGRQLAIDVTIGGVFVADSASFAGTPPSSANGGFTDTDSDGLYDHEEQRGWTVVVVTWDGQILMREVTSDPGDPTLAADDPIRLAAGDSDGDGLGDKQELDLRTDPRDPDTDDDQLGDAYEFNAVFTDPLRQDTDADGLSEGLEVMFFRTSPLFADTDGDQIPDGDEVVLSSRDARIADLPQPAIEIGSIDLQLDVRFDEVSEQGTTEVDAKEVSASLTQSDTKTFGRSNTESNEVSATIAQKFTYETNLSLFLPEVKLTSETSLEASYSHGWSSTWSQESTAETQRSRNQSLTTSVEVSETSSVARRVEAASIKANVVLRAVGNVSFNIRDLQITALMADRRKPGTYLPVATLVPEIPEGSGLENSYYLGPLVGERGPIVFTSRDVFPQLVDRLMADPTGLLFKVSNYNVTDELGRNFAFTSQDVAERTSGLVFDYGGADQDGDGVGDTTEIIRVATSMGQPAGEVIDEIADAPDEALAGYGLDPQSADDMALPIAYDLSGKAVGMQFHDVMENILGLERYDEGSDTTSPAQMQNSYATETTASGLELITRIRQTKRSNLRFWSTIDELGFIPGGALSFGSGDIEGGSQTLKPGKTVRFAYVQDLDHDLVPARLEYLYGCKDTEVDTDGDGLGDLLEIYGPPKDANGVSDQSLKWIVEVNGFGAYEAFARCNSVDSDLDGLFDREEYDGRIYQKTPDGKALARDGGGAPIPDPAYVGLSFERTDPKEADTDGDGISDRDELLGYPVNLYYALGSSGPSVCVDVVPDDVLAPGRDTVRCTSDPLNPDSDGDLLPDGGEAAIGSDPSVNDGEDVFDRDGDGLRGREETTGWTVDLTGGECTTAPSGVVLCLAKAASCAPEGPDHHPSAGCAFANEGQPPTSNVLRTDTDNDGLDDLLERSLLTHPRDADTDNDGLTDLAEHQGVSIEIGGQDTEVATSPLDADSDDDLLLDGYELLPYQIGPVFKREQLSGSGEAYSSATHPAKPDYDADELGDASERERHTDWQKPDTDEDSIWDGTEANILGTDPLNGNEACVEVGFSLIRPYSGKTCEPAGLGEGDFEGKVGFQAEITGSLSAKRMFDAFGGPQVEVSLAGDQSAPVGVRYYFRMPVDKGKINFWQELIEDDGGSSVTLQPRNDAAGSLSMADLAQAANGLLEGSRDLYADGDAFCSVKLGYYMKILTQAELQDAVSTPTGYCKGRAVGE